MDTDTTSSAPALLKAPLPLPARPAAVAVRGACVTYANSNEPVLNGLNLSVPEGYIYGLLGMSGCGKTTLLRCIVGRQRLDRGTINVLGLTPGESGSGLPGPTVGYMPQELALHNLFSIEETFTYFGWISGMSRENISKRMNALIALLQIPNKLKIVGKISAGEQRRVSLGVALLTNAPILLLDEPTVGVDSVLREKIWNLLLSETQSNHITVIVTTHYIEEARHSDKVGLMRHGVILDEDSPTGLLTRYRCLSLEEVFLKLSLKQNNQQKNTEIKLEDIAAVDTSSTGRTKEIELYSPASKVEAVNESHLLHSKPIVLRNHTNIVPCTWKMFVYMWRNKSIVAVSALIPIVVCLLFGYCVGGIPTGIHLAVVNHDDSCSDTVPFPADCNEYDPVALSCRYLKRLHNDNGMFVIDEFHDITEARLSVERGKAWGFLHFPSNYSSSLVSRQRDGLGVSDYVLKNSEIEVWLDMSNKQVGELMKEELGKLALKYFEEIEISCEKNISIPALPMRVDIIYGKSELNVRDFYSAGVLMSVVFGIVSQYSMTAIIDSKKDGFLERSFLSGVHPLEILVSHVVVDTIMMIFMTASGFSVICGIMQSSVAGSLGLLLLLSMVNGLSGMFFGYLVATFSQTESAGIVLYMAVNFPLVVVSGLLWPSEGMHPWLRGVAWLFPQNPTVSAGRAIMNRGWGLESQEVFNGVMLTILWLFIFLGLTVISVQKRKSL